MNANTYPIRNDIHAVTKSTSTGMTIALWIGQLAVAGILGMMAFMKFFNYTPEGSMALADAMGVGRGVITMIGLVEVTVLFLILLPRGPRGRSAAGGVHHARRPFHARHEDRLGRQCGCRNVATGDCRTCRRVLRTDQPA